MATATYTEALAGTYERKGTLTKVRLANVFSFRMIGDTPKQGFSRAFV